MKKEQFYSLFILSIALCIVSCEPVDIRNYQEIRNKALSYFNCVECNEDQVEDLIAIGPEIAPFLLEAMESGPSEAQQLKYYLSCMKFASNCNNEIVGTGEEVSETSDCDIGNDNIFCLQRLEAHVLQYKLKAARIYAEVGDNDEYNKLTEIIDKLDERINPSYLDGLNFFQNRMKNRLNATMTQN